MLGMKNYSQDYIKKMPGAGGRRSQRLHETGRKESIKEIRKSLLQ